MNSDKVRYIVLNEGNLKIWKQAMILNVSMHGLEGMLDGNSDNSAEDETAEEKYRKNGYKVLSMLYLSMDDDVKNRSPLPKLPLSAYWESIVTYFESQSEFKLDSVMNQSIFLIYESFIEYEVRFFELCRGI